MSTYNTYQEAKIANPEMEVYKLAAGFIATNEPQGVSVHKCNPADDCMTVEKFLADGHKFAEGDLILDEGVTWTVSDKVNSDTYIYTVKSSNKPDIDDNDRYILRAAALENQMNIDNLATQTPEEKEALDLIDTTPHQYEMSKFSGNEWNGEGLPPVGVWFEISANLANTVWNKCRVVHYHNNLAWLDFECNEIMNLIKNLNNNVIRPTESPQQREERERLEAAYDLYCHTTKSRGDMPYGFEYFLDTSKTGYLVDYLAIVDKTKYKKGGE